MRAFNTRRVLPHPPRYRLEPPRRIAPWAAQLRDAWAPRLRNRDTTDLVLTAASASRAPKTYEGYANALNHWFEYLNSVGVGPFNVRPEDGVHFAAYLARKGTINLQAAKPYWSGINQFYEDLGMRAPCKGQFFSQVRKGLVNMQVDTRQEAHIIPLPAPVIKTFYDLAVDLGQNPERAAQHASALRDLLVVVLGFVTMSRPISLTLLSKTDVAVAPQQAQPIVVTRDHVKTDHGPSIHQTGRFPVRLPHGFAALATAFKNFQAYRNRVHPFGNFFFELPGDAWRDESPHGAIVSDMLTRCLRLTAHAPPANCSYSAKSLRSGGASAADAVPVARRKIEWIGGWARRSDVVDKHYVYADTPPTHAGRFFFSWIHAIADDDPAAEDF